MRLHYSNPRTILNYIGGLTSVLRRMRVDVSPFSSLEVADFMTSIRVNVRTLVNKRLPVQHEMLIRIVAECRREQEGHTLAFAFILMYMTFLRQSNLGPSNKTGFDGTRHLTRGDVIVRNDAVIIAIKWSKAQQGPTATSVAAPAKPGSTLCPVRAFNNMILYTPTLAHSQPLCSFRDASPMPTSYMNNAWDRILARIGCPPRAFTLHSLRRGGATQVYNANAASIHQLKSHGQWSSDAIMEYLPNDPSRSAVFQYFKDM